MEQEKQVYYGSYRHRDGKRSLRFSMRYKIALPVLVLVTLMLFMVFKTTFRVVNDLVLERNESRLLGIAQVFTESLKVPIALGNQEVLIANLDWMARRSDVLEVRVEDAEGTAMGSTELEIKPLPDPAGEPNYLGVQRIGVDQYAVAVPIRLNDRYAGRLIIIFSQLGFEAELQSIFAERMMFALVMGIVLAFLTASVTWLLLRPLTELKRTVQDVLSGDLRARARIYSFDEIEDLADAFNEMVSRLTRTLENLRSRTQALAESEEKYRLIIDHAEDFIFAITPEGDIAFLNEGFSGYSREELLHGGLELVLNLHTDDTRPKFEEALEILQRTKDSVTHVASTQRHKRTGHEISYQTNLTPMLNHEGEVKLIQGVMRDVTELRRIEMMKDSLIRDVAHELKTPTAKFEMAVNWFEKEMREQPEMQKYGNIVEMLRNNTDRLMTTITSIMDLSRLESGMTDVVKSDIDLNNLLREVCHDMEPLCRQQGLILETSLAEEVLPLRGDHDMLYRLFVNLIGNSIKFTPKGSIALRSWRDDDMIFAEVRDTGMGISPDDLEKIFDRFVQKTASSLGIGVGLTISRDIANLHDGNIRAESGGAGKGALFKVEFPVGEWGGSHES